MFDFASFFSSASVNGLVGVLLTAALVVFVCRSVVVLRATSGDEGLINRLKGYVREGEIESARNLCLADDNPATRLLARGLAYIGRSTADIQAVLAVALDIEMSRLERGAVWLKVIAVVAPVAGAGLALAASSPLRTLLPLFLPGIAAGLLAWLAYVALNAMLHKARRRMEERMADFLDLLNEPAF